MSALCRGVDTYQGPSCIRSAPEFAELAYRLIYVLCADRETSDPVLRYLRTHDFLFRHAQHLPFAAMPSGKFDGQIGNALLWLVKQKQRGLRGLLCRWPSITEWEIYITAQGPPVSCVEWDVKLYYTIPYHTTAV